MANDDEITKAIESAARAADAEWNALRPDDQALLLACDKGSAEDVLGCLRKGANVNAKSAHGSALCLAIRSGRDSLPKLKQLLAAHADPELLEAPALTPLVVAASNNRADLIRLLVAAGARVNSQESAMRWSALMTAACHGSVAAASELLDLGADLFLESEHGKSAIDLARANRQTAILLLFLKWMEKSIGNR